MGAAANRPSPAALTRGAATANGRKPYFSTGFENRTSDATCVMKFSETRMPKSVKLRPCYSAAAHTEWQSSCPQPEKFAKQQAHSVERYRASITNALRFCCWMVFCLFRAAGKGQGPSCGAGRCARAHLAGRPRGWPYSRAFRAVRRRRAQAYGQRRSRRGIF